MGTAGLLVLKKDVLLREECAGQEGGGGPGSNPLKFIHSTGSLRRLWQKSRAPQPGEGKGPSRQHLGETGFGEIDWL